MVGIAKCMSLHLLLLAEVENKGGLEWITKEVQRSISVSYTHLDVYKRQLPSRPSLCCHLTSMKVGMVALAAFLLITCRLASRFGTL